MNYQKLFEKACEYLAQGECNLSVCETGSQLCEATHEECVQCWINYFIQLREKEKSIADYDKCKDCKWLSENTKSIGRECVNPNRKWRTDVARWHAPSAKACKAFERKEE